MRSKGTESLRKAPQQERARETVNSILVAAAHILKTQGPQQLTTNRVAKVAGVSIGSLYQYFASKQGILDALRAAQRLV